MQRLLLLLDDEVGALEALVHVTQQETQHLLAFEPEGLEHILEHKKRLLAREDELRLARQGQVRVVLARGGSPEPVSQDATLSQLIVSLPAHSARPLTLRRDRLRALIGALRELNQVAGFHARRQLTWARSCRQNVTPVAGTVRAYGPQGRPDARYGGGYHLNARV